ncbi:hypothetical protein [Kiloniella sp. b19]|uniref:hypothetical protein n=1 Tax=Kiloniella sp. GXU_MW_B19 TaxID=3141326 RepID=UPI0031E22646
MKLFAVSKKTFLMSAAFCAFALSSAAFAADTPEITCRNVPNYADKFGAEDNPFYDIDVDRTLAQLSEDDAIIARALNDRLERLYEKMDADTQIAYSTFEEAEVLEEELEELLDEAGVEPVTVNLLSPLSSADQRKALDLWCDIAAGLDQQEQDLERKLDKLDRLLDSKHS